MSMSMSMTAPARLETAMTQVARRHPGNRFDPVAGGKEVSHPCRHCRGRTVTLRFHTVDRRGDLDAWHKCLSCGSMRQTPLPSSGDTLDTIHRIQKPA